MDHSRRQVAGPRPLPPQPTRTQSSQQVRAAQPTRVPTPQAPAERIAQRSSPNATRRTVLEPVMEGDTRLLRDVWSPPPGDVLVSRRQSNPEIGRQRSQYFERAFATKSHGPQNHPVRANSMILCELKTSAKVRDDVAFIRDLTHHLASRYQRPLSSVVVTFESARMYFAGSFDPAYSVAIHALASQAGQAATNKRNLGLLQKHLSHSLGISPDRGLVRYNVVSEECFGWGGSTVVGQIASDQMRARREKPKHSQTSDEGERRGVVRSLSHRLRSDRSKVRLDETVTTPLRPMARVSEEPVSSCSNPVKTTEVNAEPYKEPLSRRVSFLQGLFGKHSRVEPNVDESAQTP